ncbi:MAG: right-handed parallel beta-helix repeat-containing protein [Candidatus Eisenbacteria bacterium]
MAFASRSTVALCLGLTLASASIEAATAAIWSVYPDGSGDFPTIQSAIGGATDGDIILLGDGTFEGVGNRNIDGLGKALTIQGNTLNPALCVIDCNASSADRARGFNFHSGETVLTVLEGVTIKGAVAPVLPDRWGGGVLCVNSSITLRNCIVHSNHAGWGAGLLFWGSASLVQDVWVADNVSDVNGGGIYCTTGDATHFERVTVVGNSTDGRGAALVANTCEPFIRDCTIHGNHAGAAGAIWVLGGASPHFSNTIITGTSPGAVMECGGGSPTFSCCDLFGNEDGNWTDCIVDQYGTNGNFSADPVYCDPASRVFTLTVGSPCSSDENPACGPVGAWPVGCGQPVVVLPTTWGRVKAKFGRVRPRSAQE